MTSRKTLYQEAEAKRRECREWLKRYMASGRPKPMTKNELFDLAKREIGISRAGFDEAWIWAIEETGREDWYEPTRSRRAPLH